MYIKTTEFTFHYVSIKSDALLMPLHMRHTFTFHYVSIKSSRRPRTRTRKSRFTFHYVSIKSPEVSNRNTNNPNLHSTMYLLNPAANK